MTTDYEIGRFREEDIVPVVRLWKMLFKGYPLSAESLKNYTFLNPDFDPAGCLVARENEEVVGFILATAMRIPETPSGELPGCVAVLMVRPEYQKEGIGSALLKEGERYLTAQGKRRITVGYPTYVRGTVLSLMGIDAEWMGAVEFFKKRGFSETGRIDAGRAPLEDFQIPDYVLQRERKAAQKNIRVGVLKQGEEDRFLDFLRETFPGSWYEQFAARIPKKQLILDNVLVLRQAEQIIGFVGPFDIPESGSAALGIGIGLKQEFRGKGFGSVILFRSLDMIKAKGGKEVYIFGWRGLENYYGKAGFKMAGLFIFMEKKPNLETRK